MIQRLVFSIVLLTFASYSSQAGVRNYFAPAVNGVRLDACLTARGDCGKPAADAFCKAQGFEIALIFQREAAVVTRRLGGGPICSGIACSGFRQIKCFAPGGNVVSLQPSLQ